MGGVNIKLISLRNIDIKAGEKFLFNIESLDINTGDRIGLIGANGSGKSTFIKNIRENLDKKGVWAYQDQEKFELRGDYKQESIWGVNHLNHDYDKYSGGEKMKTSLAYIFSIRADIYVFDEPTSQLDMEGFEKFISMVKNLDTYIIISHDRNILDLLTDKTLVIKEKKLLTFPGNYSNYLQWEITDTKRQWTEYENYINEKTRLEAAAEAKKRQAKKAVKKPKGKTSNEIKQIDFGSLGKSKGGKAKSLSSQARHIEKRIEQLEVKEKPENLPSMKIEYNLTNPPKNKIVIYSENLNFSYKDKEIFRATSFFFKREEKIALIGKNGCGKTTLLSLIYKKYKDIYTVPKLKIGYLTQEMNHLIKSKTVYDNLKSVSIQNETINRIILKRVGFDKNSLNKEVRVLSSGEKVKLCLAMFCVADINFLMLDEPTSFLDIDSIKIIEQLLIEYEGSILFVSHDQRFIDNVADKRWVIEDKKIREI
ncbi:MAG: ATP-binding cassette domain-containing protein [Tissierellia bacterium]|nr:ATP-binding cassette domain-containing protein [Tissierellia bacterium]